MPTALVYPNPPIEAGFPTAVDPPLAAPMPADLEDVYVGEMIRAGGFLTSPRDSSDYDPTPKTGSTTSTVDLVITVTYGDISEVAYQSGSFTPLYIAGSTLNMGTGAYSLVREGGFPSGVTILVVHDSPTPTGGQALGTIYAVDFRTLANQTMTAAGSYTIDGLTWWAKGALTGLPFGASMASSLVNGSGLRLSVISSSIAFPASGDYVYRNFVLPLANVPNFNALAPVYVRAKFAYTFAGHQALVGLVDTTSNAADYLSANRPSEAWTGIETNSPIAQISKKYGTESLSSAAAGNGSQFFSDFFVCLYRPVTSFVELGSQVWDGSGAIPAVNNMRPQTTYPAYESGTHANPCIMFALRSQTGVTTEVYMTHLSISQPKVP